MMTKTFANVAIMAALGLLVPIQVNAFGLGKLELSSALNEPFKAEIAITALQGDDVDNLQVRLASAKEFEQAGLDRSFLLTQLKFDVVEKQGQVKIVISSEQPIREPFIDFLLTATTTSSGRLIREYTVLLDPPKSIFQKEATPTPSQNPTKVLAKTNTTTTNNTATENYQPSTFSSDSYGPISRTDTLWNMALKTRPDNNITVHQMMMALLKANPDAFQNNNVNGLKAGYTLTIPNKNDIYALTKQQAVDAFKQQNDLWKNRNARPKVEVESSAQVVVAPKSVESPATDNVATTETVAETKEVATDTDDTARLKLVVPKEQAALDDEELSPLGAEKIKTLSEQLSLAQETIEGQTQENIDFKSRMDALEVQMETMRRLISLKDADLARLQSMLESDQQTDENTLAIDAPDVDNSVAETTTEGEPLEADVKVVEGELDSLIATAQNFVANNKTEVALGAGSLLLLLALLLISRRKETDDTEDQNKPQNSNSNDGKRTSAQDKLEKAITIREAPQVVEAVEIEEETVAELIEQTDKLIAFGDYAKAMTVLEQLKQQEPTNSLILNKLLYVMFKQKLKEPFVLLASSLNVNKDSAEWLEIATWGRELAPLNALFHSTPVASEPEEVLDLASVQNDELSTDLDKEIDKTEERLSDTIEFNLDDYVKDDAIKTTSAPITAFDKANNDDMLSLDASFNLDERIDFDTPLNFATDTDEMRLLQDDEPLSLAFDDDTQSEVVSIDDGELKTVQDLNIDLNLEPEDNSFDFDISAYDEIDEAETKLDLASAYADMGDPDGARNILEEVLKEGNDEQKARAEALLKELS